MTAAEGRRGRPPRLTRGMVAQAVLETGFPRLTFAAVRERLGVGESTLFRYAPDRDELVRLGLGLVIGCIAWPELEGTWREVLARYAHCAWWGYESHPGSATEVSRGIIPSEGIRILDDVCVHLMDCGFTAQEAVLSCDLVFDLVVDSRRGVEHLDGLLGDDGSRRAEIKEVWGSEAETGWDACHRAVAEARRAAVGVAPFEWFRRKLEVLLDGLSVTIGHNSDNLPVERPE